MNKSELTELLYDGVEDMTKDEAKLAVETMLEGIKEAVAAGETFNVRSFGKIDLEKVGGKFIEKESGQKVRVAAGIQPTLTPSKEFLDMVEETQEE